jgi:hypothetical protein
MLHFRSHSEAGATPAAAFAEPDVWKDAEMLDDAGRRQLRFALFLQAFALLMMGGALFVRASTFGWDLVTGILLLAVLIIATAAVFTVSRLRAG